MGGLLIGNVGRRLLLALELRGYITKTSCHLLINVKIFINEVPITIKEIIQIVNKLHVAQYI